MPGTVHGESLFPGVVCLRPPAEPTHSLTALRTEAPQYSEPLSPETVMLEGKKYDFIKENAPNCDSVRT